MNPKVSIVIPFYNCPYIAESVQSALSQSMPAHEIIVVDDGSTAHTHLLNPYRAHIHYLGKANGGTASALNHGIRHASGDYVAWLSSDDVFYHDKLNNQAKFMQQNGLLFTYTNFNYIDAHSRATKMNAGVVHTDPVGLMRGFLQGNPVNGCTIMIRRDLFGAIGLFDENLPYTHDFDLWFRAILNGYAPAMLNQSLTGYRWHEGMGTMRHYNDILAEASAVSARYTPRLREILYAMSGRAD